MKESATHHSVVCSCIKPELLSSIGGVQRSLPCTYIEDRCAPLDMHGCGTVCGPWMCYIMRGLTSLADPVHLLELLDCTANGHHKLVLIHLLRSWGEVVDLQNSCFRALPVALECASSMPVAVLHQSAGCDILECMACRYVLCT